MLGVILWHDAKTGSGLVWCEDQKDLAVFDASAFDGICSGAERAANDHVIFEDYRVGGVRRVSRIIAHWAAPNCRGEQAELKNRLLTEARRRKLGVVAG